MPSSTAKEVTERRFLILGHREAIFGEENLLPHPKPAANIYRVELPRGCTILVDRHPAVSCATRILLGKKFSRKAVCHCVLRQTSAILASTSEDMRRFQLHTTAANALTAIADTLKVLSERRGFRGYCMGPGSRVYSCIVTTSN